jgi:exosortase/archaeosortase family protein
VSLRLTFDGNLRSETFVQEGNLTVSQFFLLALLLTLAATAADQFAAPALFSSSPLWASAVCLALVWRSGESGFEREKQASHSHFSIGRMPEAGSLGFSPGRIALFVATHVLLVSTARFVHGTLGAVDGAFSLVGWISAGLKLSVLLPTLLLLPLRRWRVPARTYGAECIAALVVLFTFFPGRIVASVWPLYGQVLGRFVFFFSGLFVHGLTYTSAWPPTIHGPDLDVTILLACSGISGIELFDYLFAFVALLDWNRIHKGRMLLIYFAGLAAMFAGNAVRIASFAILGNRGFAGVVARFHLSAGWIFFSVVFLAYLSLTYRSLLMDPKRRPPSLEPQPSKS